MRASPPDHLHLSKGRSSEAAGAGRILSFDDKAGLIWARLMAEGKAAGQPHSGLDMIITAVAGANECVVVTNNEKDFAGLQIVNPIRRPV
jgi:predicted nucleic acid-binding protein